MSTATARTPLQQLLWDEGRKQTWLAERAEISPSRLSHIVNGLCPSDDEAAAIADALRRPVTELFPALGPA